jgi:hypothetical protein
MATQHLDNGLAAGQLCHGSIFGNDCIGLRAKFSCALDAFGVLGPSVSTAREPRCLGAPPGS